MKVINLGNFGKARDLLAGLDEIRSRILNGKIKGYALTVRDWQDTEAVYLGGIFKDVSHEAVRAALKMSVEMTKLEDPDFGNSQ